MYEQVYFHKTTRAFECVLEKLFLRIKELLELGEYDKIFRDEILVNFIKNPSDLESFLKLDDVYFEYYFKIWVNVSDGILSLLAKNILYRNPPKLLKSVVTASSDFREWYVKIVDDLRKILGEEWKYLFYEDDYKNVPLKDNYLLGKTTPEKAERIWVYQKDGEIKDIAELSPLLNALRNKEFRITRFYVDREYYKRQFK